MKMADERDVQISKPISTAQTRGSPMTRSAAVEYVVYTDRRENFPRDAAQSTHRPVAACAPAIYVCIYSTVTRYAPNLCRGI